MQPQAISSHSEEPTPAAACDRLRVWRILASTIWRKTMTAIKTIAVAGLLSVMAAAPAFAQAAIQEPGLFSFYHPNLDVLNDGAPTPAYRLESQPPSATQAYALRESGLAGNNVWHYRHLHRTSGMLHNRR
jgi:hypothetical protein